MKTFESRALEIAASQSQIYNYLADFRNFGELMPSEITNWKADATTCFFTIQNMADLNMGYGDSVPQEKIIMKSQGKNPFDYDLNILIQNVNKDLSEVKIVFNADLNPMLAMMASTPLENFINMLVEKLKEIMEG